MKLHTSLISYIENLDKQSLSSLRKEALNPIRLYIKSKQGNEEPIKLNFICTHNSRRSILAQVWSHTIADYFGIKNVRTYSGGTQETEVYKGVIESLKDIGFDIKSITDNGKSIWHIHYANNKEPIQAFSKVYDHTENPSSGFAAIMTCSQADVNCPIILGADKRFSLTYDDPKEFDNSKIEKRKYEETCLQIAAEIYCLYKKLGDEKT